MRTSPRSIVFIRRLFVFRCCPGDSRSKRRDQVSPPSKNLSYEFKFFHPPHQSQTGVTQSRPLHQSSIVNSHNFFSCLQTNLPRSPSPVQHPSLIPQFPRMSQSTSTIEPSPYTPMSLPVSKAKRAEESHSLPHHHSQSTPPYIFVYTVLPNLKNHLQGPTISHNHYRLSQPHKLPQHNVETWSCGLTDPAPMLSVHLSTHHHQSQTNTGSYFENHPS